jgi:hypothetical protein
MSTNTNKGFLQNPRTALVITWLVAGTLDALGAITSFLIKGGKNPEVIFKYIASGVAGRKAMTGGMDMVLLGIVFHYLIAFCFTLFFFWLYPHIKFFAQQPLLTGVIYGLFVWAMMNLIVLPLTKIKQPAFDLSKAAVSAGILILCIGIPVSLMANKHYLYKK